MDCVWVSFVHDGDEAPVGLCRAAWCLGVQPERAGWMYLATRGRAVAWREALTQIVAGASPRIALRDVVERLPFDVSALVLPSAPPVALWDLLPPRVAVWTFDDGELRRVFAP